MNVVLFCTLLVATLLLPSASAGSTCKCQMPPFLSGDAFTPEDEYYGKFHFDLEKRLYAFDFSQFEPRPDVHYLTIYGPEKDSVIYKTSSPFICTQKRKMSKPLNWSVQRCVPEYEFETPLYMSRELSLHGITYEVEANENGTCTPQRLTLRFPWAYQKLVLTNITTPGTSQIEGLKPYFKGCGDVEYIFGKP